MRCYPLCVALFGGLLLTSFPSLRAQQLPDTLQPRPTAARHELRLQVGSGIFTTGTDGPAVVLQGGYQYRLRPHLRVGVDVGMSHAWAQDLPADIFRYPYTTSVYGPNTPAPVFKSLDGHSTTQTMVFVDPALTLDLWYRRRHRLSASAGPGIAFVNREFIEWQETGTWTGDLTGPRNVVLLVPYYESYLDVAAHLRLTYQYQCTARWGLGLQVGTHYNLSNGDMLHLAGLTTQVSF